MNDIMIAPDELRRAAHAFAQANKDSQAIMEKLEKAMAELEGKWGGVTQQMFFKNYKDWRQYMGSLVVLLNNTAGDMQAIAERFEKADA